MRGAIVVGLFCLAFLALGQPEEFRDLGFGNKPFNPNDVGLVMRAVVRDNDPANTDPIYLTRLSVENLGTAKPEDIEWVELRMENSCGKKLVLSWGPAFPLREILLDRDPEERVIPDDGEAYFYVWVKVTERVTEGRTIQPKLILGWAEGEKGGTLELTDGAPEHLVLAGSFGAKALSGPEGGNLNPGDRFPVAEIELWDTADVNPWGLDVTKVRLDGPIGLVWLLDNGIKQLEIPAGRDYTLPEPLFAALDEAKGKITVWVEVPEGFRPKEPVNIAPTLVLSLTEASHTQVFKLADPLPDRVLAAGLEILELNIPQAGQVVSPATTTLLYSILKLGDQDRNATPVRLDSLTLKPMGTLTAVTAVEVVDQGGRLVGFARGVDQPVSLTSPDGKPLLLPDETTWNLNVTLTFSGRIPLGASLLLSHELALEEVWPKEYLPRSDALTKFKGIQTVTPAAAVFFGKPTLKLAKVDEQAVLSTDGETIGLLSGRLLVSPWELSEVTARTLSNYRLTTQPGEGAIAFTIQGGKAEAKAGDVVGFSPRLKPMRMPRKEVQVSLEARVESVKDWAGISLPFEVGPAKVTFSFSVPQLGLLPTPERKDAAVIHVDTPITGFKAYIRLDPKLPVELKEVQGLDPYTVELIPEEKPEPGRVLISVSLPREKKPASGALVQLVFVKKVQEELVLPVRLEVLEVRGTQGELLPFFLEPEALELRF